MADPVTASIAITALAAGAYGEKRTGDKQKRAEDRQKALEEQPSEEDLEMEARKRSALARARARGGFGLADAIGQGSLGSIGGSAGANTKLGS